MNLSEKIEASTGNCVLVAPLNWGLGHVTRCIPMIKALEKQQKTVYLASDGVALLLLRAEFPHLTVFELPSYQVSYPSGNLLFHMLCQLPRMMRAIYREHQETKWITKKYGVATIISDNRYGCYTADTHSILMTHQLYIPFKNRLVQRVVNYSIKKLIRPFQELWIPDLEEIPNLSGTLSHPIGSGYPLATYIGLLSRMKPLSLPMRYEVAIILSGPEPQRGLLEKEVTNQAIRLNKRCVIVQGNTESFTRVQISEKVEVISFLTATDLNILMESSRVIVCRSGYSSLMDLVALGKKAILIPTPGQPEQEYLAAYITDRGLFICQDQGAVNLEQGLVLLGS